MLWGGCNDIAIIGESIHTKQRDHIVSLCVWLVEHSTRVTVTYRTSFVVIVVPALPVACIYKFILLFLGMFRSQMCGVHL